MDTGEWYYIAVQEASNSHEPEYKDKLVPGLSFNYEKWITYLVPPDWLQLERQWIAAYSR